LNTYLQTKVEKLTVVKTFISNPSKDFNNQSQYVRMNILYDRIIYLIQIFTKNKIKPTKFLSVNFKDALVRDFLFLMNFFGNDFIHAIPTTDIGTCIMNVIFIYSKFIEIPKNFSILNKSKDNKVFVNYNSFTDFMIFIAEYEDLLMMDTYLANTENANKLQKIFGRVFTMKHLIDYREKILDMKIKLHQELKTKNNFNLRDIVSALNVMMNNLENIKTITGNKYSDIFVKLELKFGKISINDYAISIHKDINILLQSNPKYIYKIKTRHDKNEKFIIENIKDIEMNLIKHHVPLNYDDISNNNRNFSFDYMNIRSILPHEMMITTENDIKLYLLHWKADKWKHIFNSKSFELGYDSNRDKPKSLEKEIKRYQYEMLKLSDTKLEKLIVNYIRTLSWITDYYLNSQYEITNKFISTWGFTYDRSPFLTMISDFLKKQNLNNMKYLLKDIFKISLVKHDDYISKEQHKLYIYPHKKEELKELYSKIDKKYIKAFPDIEKYVKESMINYYTNKDGDYNVYFDCRMISYFSKCIIESRELIFKELKNITL
jgi:hypothetical protein